MASLPLLQVRDTARAAAEAVDTIRHAAEGAGEPGKGLQEVSTA